MYQVLDNLHRTRGPFTQIIHGDATGADHFAKLWCRGRLGQASERRFRARWDDLAAPGAVVRESPSRGTSYNVIAGLQRNQRMIDEGKPQLCIAFMIEGRKNSGTRDMVSRCLGAGIEVIENVYRDKVARSS